MTIEDFVVALLIIIGLYEMGNEMKEAWWPSG